MSLYFEASKILENQDKQGGSLKSRVYGATGLKSPAVKIYALLIESLKWSPYLKEVIEKSGLLQHERKLSAALAVLLVHDLLLAKGGIAAPKNHALRASVEKHKARLGAELTRCRIKMGFGSIEAFRAHVNGNTDYTQDGANDRHESRKMQTLRHPRWVRVNTLKGSLQKALDRSFKDYTRLDNLESILKAPATEKSLYIDQNIPDLIAVPPGHDLSKLLAYVDGSLIFQDKASCFPAYLLNPQSFDGDMIDTCAAPGNKTTHLAALAALSEENSIANRQVLAFERDKGRSEILQKMVLRANGGDIISISKRTDFLTTDPDDPHFSNVHALLLDPSCSGTGIVGRDDLPKMHLPQKDVPDTPTGRTKKRKRINTPSPKEKQAPLDEPEENDTVEEGRSLEERLKTLSAFQLQLIRHAMKFPAATRITYSTCSIHAEENEIVVMEALASEVARLQGWRIMHRRNQPVGLKNWGIRGKHDACSLAAKQLDHPDLVDSSVVSDIADACIRCEKGTTDGTMGFFLAGFMRESGSTPCQGSEAKTKNEGGEEWTGFSDADEKD